VGCPCIRFRLGVQIKFDLLAIDLRPGSPLAAHRFNWIRGAENRLDDARQNARRCQRFNNSLRHCLDQGWGFIRRQDEQAPWWKLVTLIRNSALLDLDGKGLLGTLHLINGKGGNYVGRRAGAMNGSEALPSSANLTSPQALGISGVL
jgi:hypothetical protein